MDETRERLEKEKKFNIVLLFCVDFGTSQTWSCSILTQLCDVDIISPVVEITGLKEARYIVHGWGIR